MRSGKEWIEVTLQERMEEDHHGFVFMDLADAGASPVEIVDRIRDLAWQGVVGNTEEMLFRPDSLEEFASQSSAPPGSRG